MSGTFPDLKRQRTKRMVTPLFLRLKGLSVYIYKTYDLSFKIITNI